VGVAVVAAADQIFKSEEYCIENEPYFQQALTDDSERVAALNELSSSLL
jgi:hypothetical protein